MKSILFNNACVITARFLVSLDFLFPRFFARKKESQGSLLFLALFCFQGAVLSSDSFNIISLPNAFVNTFSKIFFESFSTASFGSDIIISSFPDFVNYKIRTNHVMKLVILYTKRSSVFSTGSGIHGKLHIQRPFHLFITLWPADPC